MSFSFHSLQRTAPAVLAGLCATTLLLTSALAAATAPAPRKAAASARRKPAAPVRKSPEARISYNRQIRPILAENCFSCHGPDSASRMAGLRLDIRSAALSRGVLAPGKPQASRLIQRVDEPDPTRAMPPASSHRQLTVSQKNLLRRWVAQGAVYEPHWAFVPLPRQIAIPVVTRKSWPAGPLDRFVLARLEKEGLKPAPEATPEEWLRRVTLDLTGLPPTPEEIDAYLADRPPGARERVVDRLLASPRFGERMATPWLDLARYADSYGYQSDQLSPTWPYRDWVVRAFISGMPYDRFLTWQLAGDLLPGATSDQKLATSFNRLHRMTNEGGSVPEEWRLEGVADRVNTFGTAVLGLTLECARCHDHKYDPISQREYYSLSAFFNSIDEHGLYDRADIVPAPSLLLPTPEQQQEQSAAREAVASSGAALQAARREGEAKFAEWLGSEKQPVTPDLTGRFDFEEWRGPDLPNHAPDAKHGGKRLEEVPLVEGPSGLAAAFDGENNVNFPELGKFRRHTPFTIAFRMRDAGEAAEPAVIFQACSGTDTGPHGYDLLLEKGRLTARLFRHWPGNAIGVRTRAPGVKKGEWTHVAVSYDGSSRAAGFRIYLNGEPAELDVLRDHLYRDTYEHPLVFGQRFRDRGFKGGRIDDLFIFNRDVSPLEAAHLSDGRTLTESLAGQTGDGQRLRDYYFSAIHPASRVAARSLAEARKRLVDAENAQLEVAVMSETASPRAAYVLPRGQYDAPDAEKRPAPRGVLSLAPAPAGAEPRTRLDLAKWLTGPDHPLTARAAVNRFWSMLWGRGLVETTENLGIQGSTPSHPELLDWLARDFISSGWDQKRLLRQMVLSATYRQSSSLTPELVRSDPENRLLARGPASRLSAEAIRDSLLFAAGLLDERRGGPPVSPYQPGDLWREANTMSPPYKQSVGNDLYRRSLYSVIKRTAPMPNMTIFDAGSREVCTPRRGATSTPLQALVLLNDVQFVEAARVLVERTLLEAATAPARIDLMFRRLTGRPPHPGERDQLVRLLEAQSKLYAGAADEAGKLIAIGARPPAKELQPVEVAAYTGVAQAILSLDATLWKR